MTNLFSATRRTLLISACALAWAGSAYGGFLNVTSVTPGSLGTFTGTLDGVSVTGGVAPNPGVLVLNVVGLTAYESSVTDGSSPQYSYPTIYAATAATTDMLGLTKFGTTAVSTGTLTLTFASPMTNLLLQVGNVDQATWNLSGTPGLTALSLVSGNGGGGDGLGVSGLTLFDINPAGVGLSPGTQPPVSGARSGYGSVLLVGTYSSLVMNFSSTGGDGFNFTLVTTPEPSTWALGLLGFGLAAAARRRRG